MELELRAWLKTDGACCADLHIAGRIEASRAWTGAALALSFILA